MKPHKHCEIIKAWADGHMIQGRDPMHGVLEWKDSMSPTWFEHAEYRVKQEPPKYPQTKMTDSELTSFWVNSVNGVYYAAGCYRTVANAAIARAIEDKQVMAIPSAKEFVQSMSLQNTTSSMKVSVAGEEMVPAEMLEKVAEAVRDACRKNFDSAEVLIKEKSAYGRISNISLSAIIAAVKAAK